MEHIAKFSVKLFLLAHIVHSAVIVDTWQGSENPIVQTSQGLVRGVRAAGTNYTSFGGIPYARVNASNPFGSALPAPVFQDVFIANDDQVACPQTGSNNDWQTTLDCLRLNIYVPNEAKSSNSLPVLVWIHGGGFTEQKAGDYSPENLIKQDILVVTLNYRMGAYGFMCLNTPEVPGNTGLKDQLAALRWIKQNIAAFGGNPDRITISGQSAGAASVNHHLYSRQANEQLFHQVILQSGTTIPLLAANDEQAAIRMAEHLGFNAQDTESAIAFLANRPIESVTLASVQLGYYFLPCIEKTITADSLVTTNPIWATFPRQSVPVMIGVNSFELIGFGPLNFFSSSFRDGIASRFDFSDEQLDRLTKIVRHFYAGAVTDESDIVAKLEEFDTDLVYHYPLERELSKLVAQGAGPVYSYVFEYVGEHDAGDREQGLAPHNAELKYLYSNGMNVNETFNEEEQEISDRITTLWANFVKEGNPTPASSSLLPWPAVSGDARPYWLIGLQPTVRNSFMHANVAFWQLFYKSYSDNDRAVHF